MKVVIKIFLVVIIILFIVVSSFWMYQSEDKIIELENKIFNIEDQLMDEVVTDNSTLHDYETENNIDETIINNPETTLHGLELWQTHNIIITCTGLHVTDEMIELHLRIVNNGGRDILINSDNVFFDHLNFNCSWEKVVKAGSQVSTLITFDNTTGIKDIDLIEIIFNGYDENTCSELFKTPIISIVFE